jgi:hypothetical protein
LNKNIAELVANFEGNDLKKNMCGIKVNEN